MKRLFGPLLIAALCGGGVWADEVPSPDYRPEPASAVRGDDGYDTGRTSFSVQTDDGLTIDYTVFALFVLPGEQISLETSESLRARSEADLQISASPNGLQWKAPDVPGLYPVDLLSDSGAGMRIKLLVMRPASEIEDEHLDEYRIGSYPAEPYRGLETYLPPEGFVEVTPELRDLRISPHFTLGQFLCKQESAWPKFVRVRERLVLKLERLLEAVNDAGIATDSFVVMSGFRTPHYNHSIGNGQHSRHIFGGAADIYVDVAPRDGVMDDLNRDGVLDEGDAAWLYQFINGLSSDPDWHELEGGLGQYGSTRAHGPFVHVDERGWPARWGG